MKPKLSPLKRKLPPWPPRAFATAGAQPFPNATLIPLSGSGPEDVVADERGRLICGTLGGRISRVDPVTLHEEIVGETGGRPLGLEALGDGRILICDSHRGLLRLDPDTGTLETLVESVEGTKLKFCSNATAARDGTIWFTESTSRFGWEQYQGAMIEHRPTGRVFRRDPDGTVTVLLRDLYFPNGITLSEDETAVFFAETDGYRLNKLVVRGPRAGERRVLAENLPGFPDNISRMKDGRFWVAMVAGRSEMLDKLGTAPGFVRQLLWQLPAKFTPEPAGSVWMMAFDEDGKLLVDLQTQRPDYSFVTGVAEANGKVYLASLHTSSLLAVDYA